jgi:hypothetical protein
VPAPAASSGVQIYTAAHYDQADVWCTTTDSTISDLSQANLVFYGPNGGDSTSGSVTFLVSQQNSAGSWDAVGTYTDNGIDMSVNRTGYNLEALLYTDAGVQAQPGATYQITAQEPSTTLGSVTFTCQPTS